MAEAKSKILIVEDDLDIAEMLNAYFRVQGYEVFTVNWGEDGVRAAQTVLPNLIILDIRLPDIDGFEVARRVREDRRTNEIPIIFLTEKRDRSDILQGLEVGADDYITKPFSVRALVARVRALLRRTRGDVKAPSIIRAGGLEIDSEKYAVSFNNSPIKLTPNEFKLLVLLASRPSQTLTREQLLEDLHGTSSSMDRSVDSHIKNLRKKLEAASGKSMIETVYGIGYRFIE